MAISGQTYRLKYDEDPPAVPEGSGSGESAGFGVLAGRRRQTAGGSGEEPDGGRRMAESARLWDD